MCNKLAFMFIKHYLCIIKLANKLNMEKETAKILPIQPTLKAMEIGEMVAFSLTQLNGVRSSAVTIGTMYNKKFKTHVNRVGNVLEVTRIY
nr:MAG TPA: hypothetical protein [Caudoviricetes sp.]